MKRVPQITPDEAARLVEDGQTLMAGGFGMTGNPVHLLHALAETGVKNLTYIGNNVGEVGLGGGRLLRNGQIAQAIGSYFTSNPEAVAAAQSGAKRLLVTMTHTTPKGASKIVPECTLPLAARGVVEMVITDLAVFRCLEGRLTLVELMPGATLEQVRAATAASFEERLGS